MSRSSPLALQSLQKDSVEPLQSMELSALSMKVAILIVVTSHGSLSCYPETQAWICARSSHYSISVDQVVNLQTFPSDKGNPALSLLCPVHALHIYLDQTFR